MIEIINYERANKNKVIGYVDIILPPMNVPKMIIRKIAHLQSGDRKWFNLPTFARERYDGSQNFLRYWQFELDAHNGQMLDSLDEKVKEYCAQMKIADIPPLDFNPMPIEPEDRLPF